MIFKRREKRGFWDRIGDLLSPKKGWRRGFVYIGRRVQRLPDTPHRIALGFACGALASFSPFFTLHALVAVILAWVVRGNIIAAAFGTIVGNPVSFPFIAAASLKTGNWLLGRSDGTETLDKLSFDYVWSQPLEFLEMIFTPYLIGGIAPGLLCAAAFYFLLRPIVARFQERRRAILSERARERVLAHARRIPGAGGGSSSSTPPPSERPRRPAALGGDAASAVIAKAAGEPGGGLGLNAPRPAGDA